MEESISALGQLIQSMGKLYKGSMPPVKTPFWQVWQAFLFVEEEGGADGHAILSQGRAAHRTTKATLFELGSQPP